MLRNYIKIIFRNFLKSPLYVAINITGFALGLLSVIFIVRYVTYEMSYDDSLDNDIYRVVVHTSDNSIASTPVPLGPVMQNDLAQVSEFCRFYELEGIYKPYPDQEGIRMDQFLMGDGSIPEFFNVNFVQGTAADLSAAGTVVLSESMANSYGETIGLGDEVTFFDQNFGELRLQVVGIMQDWPSNSHIQANGIVSLQTLNLYNENSPWASLDNWGWNDYYTYVKLDGIPEKEALTAIIDNNVGQDYRKQYQIELDFQSVSQIHTHSNLSNELNDNNNQQTLNYLIYMAVFILIIASVNYINLTSVRGMQRAKEVGIRKNLGATRKQVLGQFNMEAGVMLIISLLLALTIYQLVKPIAIVELGEAFNVSWQLSDLMILLLFLVPVFLWSSLQPAWMVSAVSMSDVIKGKVRSTRTGMIFRNGTILIQMTVSIVLIFSAIFIYRQIQFLQNNDLGMSIEQLLVVQAPQESFDNLSERSGSFASELRSIASVGKVSASGAVPGKGYNWSTSSLQVRNMEPLDVPTRFSVTYIDDQYVDAYQIDILAGSGGEFRQDSVIGVLINELAVKDLGFKSSNEAVGSILVNGDNLFEVQGVIGNYYHDTMKEFLSPTVFLVYENSNFFSIQYNTGDAWLQVTTDLIDQVQALYAKHYPGATFQYFFMDDYFDQQYRSEVKFGILVGLFCGMAVFLSCIGLIGLSSYTLQRRRKEMGIRKVLGASSENLLAFLSSGVVKMVFLASIPAIPLGYFLSIEWLKGYPNKEPLIWWEFLLPVVVLLLLALASVSLQIVKLSRTNPVESIRYE